MQRKPRRKAARSPEGLALVASWLEEPSHLTRPPVEEFLGDDETFRSLRSVSGFLCGCKQGGSPENDTLAESSQALEDTSPESSGVEAIAADSTTALSTPTSGLQPGSSEAELAPQNLPDQLRHRGVETLLNEYYKMVAKSKVESGTVANRHKPSIGDKLRGVLFPTPPRFLEAQSLVKLLGAGGVVLSGLVVRLVFFVLPLWLYALRHAISENHGGWFAACIYGIMGVLLLFLAERVHTQSNAKAENREKNTISAFHIGPDGKMPLGSYNFLAAVVRCQELAKSLPENRPPPSRGSSPHSGDQAGPGGSQPISLHVTGNREYLVLAQEIEEVKFAVLGESSIPKEPNGSGVAELRNQIKRLCDTVGIECQIPELRSVSSMMAKLKQIRDFVGC